MKKSTSRYEREIADARRRGDWLRADGFILGLYGDVLRHYAEDGEELAARALKIAGVGGLEDLGFTTTISTTTGATAPDPDSLEQRMTVALWDTAPLNSESKQATIRRYLQLARREGYAKGFDHGWTAKDNAHPYSPEERARNYYILPSKRMLREEPDPNHGEVSWRFTKELEYRRGLSWIPMSGAERVFQPYPERIRLWADLLENPYKEVPDEG